MGLLYFVGAEVAALEHVDVWVDARQFWEPVAAAGVLLLLILLRNERRERRQVETELRSVSSDGPASELIPICISCKALADQGDRWEPIEAYLARRTPDKFTHTLCPSCLERRLRG